MIANQAAGPHATHRRGLGLAIGGLIVAVGFAAFIFLIPQADSQMRSPLWIAVFWGASTLVYGLYRMVRGNSKLDHEHGGTTVDPQ